MLNLGIVKGVFGTEGSGHQKKYWTEGNEYLIKINSKYREASKEVSASAILSSLGVFCVDYEMIKVIYGGKQRVACTCKNYLGKGEESTTLYELDRKSVV